MLFSFFSLKFNSFVCWLRFLSVISGRFLHLAKSACWEGTEYLPHRKASLLFPGGKEASDGFHLDPCPSLRPHLAAGSLLAAMAGLGSLSLLPGVLPEKSLGAQWDKPARFLYGFLMTGLQYNFSCFGGRGGGGGFFSAHLTGQSHLWGVGSSILLL